MKQEATNSVIGYVYIIYNNQNEKIYVISIVVIKF